MRTHIVRGLWCLTAGVMMTVHEYGSAVGAEALSEKSRTVVASIFSSEIHADQLEPEANVRQREAQRLPKDAYDAWLTEARNERLSQLIWGPLMERYCQTRSCEPSDEEIERFNEAMRTSEADHRREWEARRETLSLELERSVLSRARTMEIAKELHTLESLLTSEDNWLDSLSAEERAAVEVSRPGREREIARGFIRTWKFNKALYEQYGGAIIFQQAGLEPLGAYRSWLEEQERQGDFQIVSPELRAKFWEYFVTEAHNFISVDDEFRQETGLRHPFEQPWWLWKKTSEPPER